MERHPSESDRQTDHLRRLVEIFHEVDLGTPDEVLSASGYVLDGSSILVVFDPGARGGPAPCAYRIPDGRICNDLIVAAEQIARAEAADTDATLLQDGGPIRTPQQTAEDIRAYMAVELREALQPYLLQPV